MRTWLLLGSVAAGALLVLYEWYCNRESASEQGHHGYDRPGPGAQPGSSYHHPSADEDFVEINTTSRPDVVGRSGLQFKLPGDDVVCSICMEHLIKRDISRQYCIIALPKCGHWFHQRCALQLLEYYHPRCPVCRIDIDSSALRSTPIKVIESTLGSDNGDTGSSIN